MGTRSDELSDESLLTGLGLGDPELAAAFVRRFERRVYGLARTILGDSSQAEDVAQEALTRAWHHAQAFDARKGTVSAWLLSITRNLAIDALRLKRPSPVDPDSVVAMSTLSDDRGPDERAVLSEDASKLKSALLELPDEQRRAIVLAGLCGRTALEVSAAENIPLGTAKTRIRSALQKLRAAIVEDEQVRWSS